MRAALALLMFFAAVAGFGAQPGQIADINVGPTGIGSDPAQFTTIGAITYFVTNDPVDGPALWRTDGTPAGTFMVKDHHTGTEYGDITSLTAMGTLLLFIGDSNDSGLELWRSDGTRDGTYMVKDGMPGQNGGIPFGSTLVVMNGNVYYPAYDPTYGLEIWKSDGTAAGTGLLKDINLGGDASPSSVINVEGTLFFAASNGTDGVELEIEWN